MNLKQQLAQTQADLSAAQVLNTVLQAGIDALMDERDAAEKQLAAVKAAWNGFLGTVA
jgi:hypothetical protein